MYDASVPVFLHSLGQLSHVLHVAQDHAQDKRIDAARLIEAKLAPDMFALARQVQAACDAAKFGVARLSGEEAPAFPDIETTFEELFSRIARTREFVQGLPRAAFDGSEERQITIKLRSGDLQMQGQSYLLHFALPNFYFHMTTAYAILRHQGVPLGKTDFLGRV